MHKIRKITPAGVVSTFAGTGTLGSTNGPALSATFNNPMGVVFDAAGNLFVADRYNFQVRKITPAGIVSTFAGNGVAGYQDGTGTAAQFRHVNSMVLDKLGNIYINDQTNNMIRMITPAGVVSTFAGTTTADVVNGTGSVVRLSSPYGLSIDNDENIYIAEDNTNRIRKMTILRGYTINPALPPGLVFNTTEGTISGTPTTISPATNYTVTAYSTCGTGTTVLTLEVAADPNANLNYRYSKTYDDDGILIGENKTFYSDNGKSIQSQTKNISSNQVLASETLYDALGRPAGSTLSAPINSAQLNYKPNFVTNTSGYKYDYRNFDGNKTDAPDAVGNTSAGTLGWYYSNNNTMEAYVPATSYPYSRTTFYNDGIGAVKKQANVGEVHKMGTGFQSSSNAMGVINELDFYNQLRTKLDRKSVV